MEDERQRLETIAADSWYARGANGASVRYCAKVWSRFFRQGACLELGPAEGLLTEELARHFKDLTVVEGSRLFCDQLQARFPGVQVVHSLFEEFSPTRKYDAIMLGHVLEHVDDPTQILTKVRGFLAPDGALFAAVPNARSVHRQAAVIMGILDNEHALNETDRHHGHRRVYDPESFRLDFLRAGFKIKVFGGYWLKPLSNSQIDASWTPEMLDAFMQVGERYPDIAAEIYVVATH